MKTLMLRVLGVALVFGVGFVAFSQSARAATFTVDNSGDASAVAPAASCDIGDGSCTLRSSIEAANAQVGADVIEFDISGAGVHTITPASNLPNITQALTIDGSTQPGASCGDLVPDSLPATGNTPHTLLIEIDGASVTNILLSLVDNIVVRGLVLNNASAGAIYLNSENNTIECNYIGTDPTGLIAEPNGVGLDGFYSDSNILNNLISGNTTAGIDGSVFNESEVSGNLIGTTVTGESALANSDGVESLIRSYDPDPVLITNNVISGNTDRGILATQGRHFEFTGNIVGLSISGLPLGNGGNGLDVDSQEFGGGFSENYIIGGTSAADRNIISANGNNGLRIYGRCDNRNSQTIGNYIGTNTNGQTQSGYGNGRSGIEVSQGGSCSASFNTYNHQIGGDEAGESNVIAGNTMDGVQIFQGPGDNVYSVSVLNNKIFANGNLGINLAADEDNNRVADAYLGPNDLNTFLMSNPTTLANYFINHPTINSTSVSGNDVTINYSLSANQADDSTLLQSDVVGYRLDFYLNDNSQEGAYPGYNQGRTHLGSFIVDNSTSNATHTFTSSTTVTGSMSINATTTVLWAAVP
jgi:hypothetical protein